MKKLNNAKLTVQNVMGWNNKEVAALTGWINAYANVLGEHKGKDAIDGVLMAMAIEGYFPAFDVDRWFYTVLSLIFHEIIGILLLENKGENTNLKKLRSKFAPETDSERSRFGNCFDEIDFKQEREAILCHAREILIARS